MSDLVPYIIWEKQEGYLCAQHCINSLLQGEYFTAVDLGEIAKNLDQAEEAALRDGVEQTPTELSESASISKSQNMDDSGFFSVQVLSHALKVWNLELVPVGSEESRASKKIPEEEDAYICNLREHWFTLRRFGGMKSRWYNLDSILNGPEWISQLYLGMLLKQLETDGYSIFVIKGILPTSQADEYAISHPDPIMYSSENHISYDSDLDAAIAASLKSVSNQDVKSESSANCELSIDDLRAKRLAKFENKNV